MFDVDVQVTVADTRQPEEAAKLVHRLDIRGDDQDIRQAVTAVLAKLTDKHLRVRVNVVAKETDDGCGQPDRTL